MNDVGQARRTFMIQTGVGGFGPFADNLLTTESALAQLAPVTDAASARVVAQNVVKVSFVVNGAHCRRWTSIRAWCWSTRCSNALR